jgi:hypothetical protein
MESAGKPSMPIHPLWTAAGIILLLCSLAVRHDINILFAFGDVTYLELIAETGRDNARFLAYFLSGWLCLAIGAIVRIGDRIVAELQQRNPGP